MRCCYRRDGHFVQRLCWRVQMNTWSLRVTQFQRHQLSRYDRCYCFTLWVEEHGVPRLGLLLFLRLISHEDNEFTSISWSVFNAMSLLPSWCISGQALLLHFHTYRLLKNLVTTEQYPNICTWSSTASGMSWEWRQNNWLKNLENWCREWELAFLFKPSLWKSKVATRLLSDQHPV